MFGVYGGQRGARCRDRGHTDRRCYTVKVMTKYEMLHPHADHEHRGSSHKERTRARHAGWAVEEKRRSLFRNVVTLDPMRVEDAWSKLAVDSWGCEFRNLPSMMHRALVVTLTMGGLRKN